MTENKKTCLDEQDLTQTLQVLKDIGNGKIKVEPEKKLTKKDKAFISALVHEYEQSRKH